MAEQQDRGVAVHAVGVLNKDLYLCEILFMFMSCSPEVIGGSKNVDTSLVAERKEMLHNVGKIKGERTLAFIQPFNCCGVSESRNSGCNPIIVISSPSFIVVFKLHVVHPTINNLWYHLFKIEPQVKPITCVGANKMNTLGFIQLCLHLTAPITRNQHNGMKYLRFC